MDNPTLGPLQPRLIALAVQGQADQAAFVAHLSAAERAATGTAETWAAKDHIAHLTAWKSISAGLLAAAARGETSPPPPDEVSFNVETFTAWQGRPWADVLAEAARVDAALTAALTGCTEADLAAVDRFPWRPGRALETLVLGNGYEHPGVHYAQFYLESGDGDRAAGVYEAALATIGRLFGESEPYSFAVYNLGCFYARTDRPAPALAAVGQALTLNPGLREWAAQDPDLVSLRADPAFGALLVP